MFMSASNKLPKTHRDNCSIVFTYIHTNRTTIMNGTTGPLLPATSQFVPSMAVIAHYIVPDFYRDFFYYLSLIDSLEGTAAIRTTMHQSFIGLTAAYHPEKVDASRFGHAKWFEAHIHQQCCFFRFELAIRRNHLQSKATDRSIEEHDGQRQIKIDEWIVRHDQVTCKNQELLGPGQIRG